MIKVLFILVRNHNNVGMINYPVFDYIKIICLLSNLLFSFVSLIKGC